MNFLNYQSFAKIFLKKFPSCSLVSGDGSLLFSKDLKPELLTTTRLVALQIVKKYLNPKPQDLFILNDPENGGYQYSKLIFISCLTSNLFIIWDEDNHLIDFKIPPTPLYDQGQRNEFVWKAMISNNRHAVSLESFFTNQKISIDLLFGNKKILQALSNIKYQQNWLKSTNEIFSIQFNSKGHGTAETYHQVLKNQNIKLKLVTEEKQNLRLITIDFTNTMTATQFHCASHVVESSIVKKIIDFYQLNDYFTQSLLDKIKIILPPKSIVSKPHLTGELNYEIQAICSQMVEHNLKLLNSNVRKTQSSFDFSNYLSFEIQNKDYHSQNFISSQIVRLQQFENLVANQIIKMSRMSYSDNVLQIVFEVITDSAVNLTIKNNYPSNNAENSIKLNDEMLGKGIYDLKLNDSISINWS